MESSRRHSAQEIERLVQWYSHQEDLAIVNRHALQHPFEIKRSN